MKQTATLMPPVGSIDAEGVYTAPAEVSQPQAILLIAQSQVEPDDIIGTAVVFITEAEGWSGGAVAR